MSRYRHRFFLFQKRMLVVYLIGLMSGLPLMLTMTVWQAWFTSANISLLNLGLLTFIGLPYTYKFLWAPFLDRYYPRLPRCSHRRKSWLVLCQSLLALIIFLISFFSPSDQLMLIIVLAMLVALISATQDMVIDAYRTEYLLPDERGMGAAAFIFAYRLAMLISGGLGLIFADRFGWQAYFIALAVLMCCGACVTYCLPETQGSTVKEKFLIKAFLEPFKMFLKKKYVGLIFIFVIFYKFGDAFTQSLGTTFFLRELHLSLSEVGILYKTVGFISTIVGAYLAGFLLPRWTLFRALLVFGFFQGVANLVFVALAYYGGVPYLVLTAVAIDFSASGMATVALLAYFMSLCDQRFTAAQFALLTAIASISRIIAGPLASLVVLHWGWIAMFILGFIFSMPSLFLLPRLVKQDS